MFLIYIYLIWTILNYTNSCRLPNFSNRHIRWVKCSANNKDWSSKPETYSVPHLHICKIQCEEGFYSYYGDKKKTCENQNDAYVLKFQCNQYEVKGCLIKTNEKSPQRFSGSYLRFHETKNYTCKKGYHKLNEDRLICDDRIEQKFIYVRCKGKTFINSIQKREKKDYCNSGDFIERNLKLIICQSYPIYTLIYFGDRTDVSQLDRSFCWPICAIGSEIAIYADIECSQTSENNQLNELRCFHKYEIKHNTVCKFPDSSEKSSLMIEYIYYDDINITESKFYGLYIDKRTFNYTCIKNAELKKGINNNTARCVNDNGIKKIIPENYGCVCKPNYKYNSDNSMCDCDDGYIKVDNTCRKKCPLSNLVNIPLLDQNKFIRSCITEAIIYQTRGRCGFNMCYKNSHQIDNKVLHCNSNGEWVTDESNGKDLCACNKGYTYISDSCIITSLIPESNDDNLNDQSDSVSKEEEEINQSIKVCDDGYIKVEDTCKKMCSRSVLNTITLLDKNKFINVCSQESLYEGYSCNLNICFENSHKIDNKALRCNSNGEWVTDESNRKDLCVCNTGYTLINDACIENPPKIIPPSRNNNVPSSTTNEINSNQESNDDSNDQSDSISKEEDKRIPKPIKEEIIDTSIQNNSSTTISSSTESTNQSSHGIKKYAYNKGIRVSITILLYYWY